MINEIQKKPVNEVFVARQPILDKNKNLYAYELLFREGLKNSYTATDGDYSSLRVMLSSFILIGLNSLTGGNKVFINFTKNLLLENIATIFPNTLLTVEILENMDIDNDLIEVCNNLKNDGYTLALDDFVNEEKYLPLVKLADIIKVDFINTKGVERKKIVEDLKKYNIKFLAEKVETYEDFHEAIEYGYSFFQGFFFSKPTIYTGKDIKGHKLNYIQILSEINNPNVLITELEKIIKRDIAITYKLLKYINSSYFSLRNKIRSIRHAISLLGLYEIKKWISFIIISDVGIDKPKEIIINCLIRAKFCELIASYLSLDEFKQDLFLMGLLSSIDVLMDQPMSKIMTELPISKDIKNALIGKENKFRYIYELILAYERGEWKFLTDFAKKENIEESLFPKIYLESIKFANYFDIQ